MKEDVGLELADEEEREGARLDPVADGLADDARAHRAGEVVGEDADRAARRNLLVFGIERNDDGGRVHLHCDRGTDDVAEERDELAREVAEHDARIGRGVEAGHGHDEVGRSDAAVAHRGGEELLLGLEVAEDGRGCDVERARDLRESRRRKAACSEGEARGFEDLFAGDARRAAHALVNVRSLTWFVNRRLLICQRKAAAGPLAGVWTLLQS